LLTYKYELHKKYKKFCMFKIIPIVKKFWLIDTWTSHIPNKILTIRLQFGNKYI